MEDRIVVDTVTCEEIAREIAKQRRLRAHYEDLVKATDHRMLRLQHAMLEKCAEDSWREQEREHE